MMDNFAWPALAWVDAPLRILENIEGVFRSGLSLPYDKFNEVITNIACGLEKINMDLETNIVTLDEMKSAYVYLKQTSQIVHTPTLLHVQSMFVGVGQTPGSPDQGQSICDRMDNVVINGQDLSKVDLCMKMENMQTTSSFKIRGVINQLRKVKEQHGPDAKLVTMSAGNYGKAFAHCLANSGTKSICIMPETAPKSRAAVIESLGTEVRRAPTTELTAAVDRLVQDEGFVYCHSFDDVNLIAGYGSAAFELLEDIPKPDVVVVCCGGGGFVSGVAAGIHLSGLKNCRVYAVEPEGAPSMFESYKSRRPVTLPGVNTVAAGLAPPFAGSICYKHCRWFVEDVLLVSDEEILKAMRLMFQRGIKAEPSGCAAMAAVLSGKVPDIEGKKVVVFVTGGNISVSELTELLPEGS